MIVILSVLVLCQHKVTMSDETASSLGLPKSEYYVVYTKEEYGRLKEAVGAQKKLVDNLTEQVGLLKLQISDLRRQNDLLRKSIESWRSQSDWLYKKWESCDKERWRITAGSWWPWVITGAAILGLVGASSAAVYYRYSK